MYGYNTDIIQQYNYNCKDSDMDLIIITVEVESKSSYKTNRCECTCIQQPFPQTQEMDEALRGTVVDISQSHARRPISNNGVARTLTTSSSLFSFTHGRLLTAYEHLLLQGYPSTVEIPINVTESDIRSMAGEGIALPCLAIIVWSLHLVQFGQVANTQPLP